MNNLRDIVNLKGPTSVKPEYESRVEPSLARGLSYYTGAIMEIAVPDLAGSLGGGGRYDNLIGMFLGHDVPACGFSLGLERIIVVMSERNMFPPSVARGAVDVMIAQWSDEHRGDLLRWPRSCAPPDSASTCILSPTGWASSSVRVHPSYSLCRDCRRR